MSGWTPKFKLYNSAGTGLLYTFNAVSYTNAPQSVEEFIEIFNIRAKGSLIIKGGEKAWDLDLNFTLIGDDYEDITAQIVTLENTIEFNVPYILRIDKTVSSYLEYKIKRLDPIVYEENLRNNFQKVRIKLRVNSW